MFDSLFFWTGVVTWFVISYILLLVVPVGIILIVGKVLLMVENWVVRNWYDSVSEVHDAVKTDEKPVKFAQRLRKVRESLLSFAYWYADAWKWLPHKLRRAWAYPF
jgi:uncharacterized protein involved in cysteine biosynthesis